jgi:hypothetical protein
MKPQLPATTITEDKKKQSHAYLIHRVVIVGNPRVPPVELPRLGGLRRRGLVRRCRVGRGVPSSSSLLRRRRAVVARARVLAVVASVLRRRPRRRVLEGARAAVPPVAAPVPRAAPRRASPHVARSVGQMDGSRVQRRKNTEKEEERIRSRRAPRGI